MRGSFDETSDIISSQDADIGRLRRLLAKVSGTLEEFTLLNPGESADRVELVAEIDAELNETKGR